MSPTEDDIKFSLNNRAIPRAEWEKLQPGTRVKDFRTLIRVTTTEEFNASLATVQPTPVAEIIGIGDGRETRFGLTGDWEADKGVTASLEKIPVLTDQEPKPYVYGRLPEPKPKTVMQLLKSLLK